MSRRRKGAATVEFALAAPILFALVLGLIEGGRMLFVLNQMSNAAREGCRVAAMANVLDSEEVRNAVDAHLESTGLDEVEATVTPQQLDTINPGDTVTVDISVPYAEASWVPLSGVLGNASIRVEKQVIRE